jgi:endonuclease/exonuclease/phosphatase (EEP) superfamily protein YafD
MSKFIMSRIFSSLILSVALAACSVQTGLDRPAAQQQRANATPVLTDAKQCSLVLQKNSGASGTGLERTDLQLFSWNTHKNTDAAMRADLGRLAEGADLILLQEAVINSEAFAGIDPEFHWSFSQGYRTENFRSGVTTASRIRPLAQCSLTHKEPWLRSPKATNITEFALADSDQTLLVVNLHLINFTIGVEAMRQQLLQALSFVEQHTGPVIVAGDFNTWNKSRRELVAGALLSRGLEPVSYDSDYRKRFLGHALDHTYIRDITVARGTSYPVNTSDHNPTSVTLKF